MLNKRYASDCRFLRGVLHPKDWPDVSGKEIAFWGRSNVGKSSLLNALMKRKNLAKVSKTPGRTQSINFYQVQEGVRYVDLPGYGYACVPEVLQNMWHKNVLEYVLTRTSLSLVVILVDSRRDVGPQDIEVMNFLTKSLIPLQCLYTKIDCISSAQRRLLKLNAGEIHHLKTSTTTGEGVFELRTHILNTLQKG
ncbi:ribosome biogenesis GTP-binding protein YihA/YsxC [Holospora curviuscula]|uniref:Probable GTP-binding protein EngB n=1 Tax=Holospora curviuscula TaxID=1082868 RepID=A0A2S5R8J5_9PROT|nr:ribosome biogenesis GTP-binding protein YihA/YsxC [Holospora curviuscula]PPE03617.1 putative GTP-binding protein EngB [Holospora curviuscula]